MAQYLKQKCRNDGVAISSPELKGFCSKECEKEFEEFWRDRIKLSPSQQQKVEELLHEYNPA